MSQGQVYYQFYKKAPDVDADAIFNENHDAYPSNSHNFGGGVYYISINLHSYPGDEDEGGDGGDAVDNADDHQYPPVLWGSMH